MRKLSILCVDDEKVVLNSLKEQLKSKIGNEYIIEIAESGEDALEIFDELMEENIEVPLVISDYIMPGMKGDELLTEIHKLNPDTMKILLTGQATLDGVTNIVNKANLYRYIPKPWQAEDLILAVVEAVKSYEKDRKIEEQNKLLQSNNLELMTWTEAFVEAMGTALDTRDTATAGHSKHIAEYSVKLAEAINRVNYGTYRDFSFTNDEIKELYYSALLHDIGKIGVREQILLKQQRISPERQIVILYRFNWVRSLLSNKAATAALSDVEKMLLSNLDAYHSHIREINRKEILDDSDICKLKEIAEFKYVDIDQKEKNLLDEFELDNLSVKRGNLTTQEREIINTHAEFTYNILRGIPWPKYLERIPEIASCHHERLNGSGYYRKLKNDEICIQSRILAILDIFEALTAPDRPYRKKKSVEEALKILEYEVSSGNLDKDIFEIFIKEKIYNKN